jgi:hypothetical protein
MDINHAEAIHNEVDSSNPADTTAIYYVPVGW